MIVAKIIGGLGNQLFQYAVARHLAHIHDTELKLDNSSFITYKLHQYSLHHFNISATTTHSRTGRRGVGAAIEKLMSKLFPATSSLTMVQEKQFTFDSSILELPDKVCLSGYWQSEKYFKAIESIIRDELTIVTPPDAQNEEMADRIKDYEAVSLHIRRGDYVANATTNAVHGTCSLDYYQAAVLDIASKVNSPVFFLFSDDMAWVKENLRIDFPTVCVDINGADKNYEDLRLMSYCRHNIIANSSFSWWGAWLNANPEKLVYAPQKWFADAKYDTKDLIPAGWIRL